jgi:hypothetical protein
MDRRYCYCANWLKPQNFTGRRGKWSFTQSYGRPDNLPKEFKLIRMLLRANHSYPSEERDRYDWEFKYNSFYDHLALLFAHELHHFRRYHLGLHPGEGEKSTNRWALHHVQNLGYKVTGRQIPVSQRRRTRKRKLPNPLELINPLDYSHKKTGLVSTLAAIFGPTPGLAGKKLLRQQNTHFETLRNLKPGSELHIVYDPSKKYQNQKARLVRVMQRNSVRMVIETDDGKKWRWPMAWLKK